MLVQDLINMLLEDGWEHMEADERRLDEDEHLWVFRHGKKPGRITILGKKRDIVPPDVLERTLRQARIGVPA